MFFSGVYIESATVRLDARCTRDIAELSWNRSLAMARGSSHFRSECIRLCYPKGYIYPLPIQTNGLDRDRAESFCILWAFVNIGAANSPAVVSTSRDIASESIVIFKRLRERKR